MDFLQEEELSFAPFHLNIPHLQKEYAPPKTIISIIQDLFSSPFLLNIVFSCSEASYLREKYPNPDYSIENISKLISEYEQNPSNGQPILEELNCLAIMENNRDNVMQNLKQANLPSKSIGWFQTSLPPIQKCLVLNLVSLLFKYIELSQDKLNDYWTAILESALVSNGSMAKKHLIVLFLIVSHISHFYEISDSQLKYSFPYPQLASTSSIDNPLIFPYYVSGDIPQSYIKGDSIINGISNEPDKNFVEYVNTGIFSSDSMNQNARSFLLSCGTHFQKFVSYLTQLYQINSRVKSPMSHVDLIFQSNSQEIEAFDLDNEKDLITLVIWSNIYVTNILLNKSNFMDGAIFRHLFSLKTCGVCLITSFFQCYPTELKSFAQNKREILNSMPYKYETTDEYLQYPFLFISTALAFHTIAEFISYANRTMKGLFPEKSLKTLLTTGESTTNPLVKSEIAYLLGTFLRCIPTSIKNKMGASSIKFIFLNLQQFDLIESFNMDNQIDLTPKCTGEDHIAQIRKHCANLNLQSPF